MEPLAVNEFQLTKKLFYEGVLRVYKENHGKTSKNAVLFIFLAWVALTVITIALHQVTAFVFVEFFIIILIFLWILVYMPRRKARGAYQQMVKRNGTVLTRTTNFYHWQFEVITIDGKTTFKYSEIADILYSKHLIILIMEDNTGVLVERSGFSKGTENEVLDLITS